ncbi:protein of unknown function [Cupriavidus taiwanensis]|uniref:Uncharacterized protein n=1 Tax=Cupriavidus taiwanensis TaxID=164546 RepID=A0A375ICV1_9BURK|nr:hypothetical protein CBM2608_A100019 [Cupriavidus taiwanensis]SPA25497.1 hypothetical protein CBM2623_A120019 [Cupriavidus taiwanensis]SPA43947.1 hypothetical protein CBM2629_A100145 [Cupriavidus taiwanensis]SPK72417.1 protein of unknown function [Cupriavidus taiwanensis]
MKNARWRGRFLILAEWTGLEPATPGVTGRYSNRLNYHSCVGSRIVMACNGSRWRNLVRSGPCL